MGESEGECIFHNDECLRGSQIFNNKSDFFLISQTFFLSPKMGNSTLTKLPI